MTLINFSFDLDQLDQVALHQVLDGFLVKAFRGLVQDDGLESFLVGRRRSRLGSKNRIAVALLELRPAFLPQPAHGDIDRALGELLLEVVQRHAFRRQRVVHLPFREALVGILPALFGEHVFDLYLVPDQGEPFVREHGGRLGDGLRLQARFHGDLLCRGLLSADLPEHHALIDR